MDLNKLISQYGERLFKLDGENDFGSFMRLENYTVYLRKDDVMVAQGLTVEEFHPLINKLCRMDN